VTTPKLAELTADQRAELHAVYASVASLHHIPFELALADTAIRICLWNVAQARRKVRARQRAAAEFFELRP
jgi:hypothetical protein